MALMTACETEYGMSEINLFPLNKPWFSRVCNRSLLKTLSEKDKLLVTSNFSFFHSVFYSFGELSSIFIKIGNGRLQTLSVWKILKIVVWERVNDDEMLRQFIQTCRLTGGSQLPFIILRALILYIILQYLSIFEYR